MIWLNPPYMPPPRPLASSSMRIAAAQPRGDTHDATSQAVSQAVEDPGVAAVPEVPQPGQSDVSTASEAASVDIKVPYSDLTPASRDVEVEANDPDPIADGGVEADVAEVDAVDAEAADAFDETPEFVETISTATDGGININTASAEQLVALPGIGEVKAAAIVAYREEHGPFADIADIVNVRGIGEKTYEALRNLIVVN